MEIKQEVKEPVSVQRETVSVNSISLAIAKPIVEEYGPQFTRNYRLWQKNSDFDVAQLKSNPLYWTNWDVYEFVERALKSSNIAQMLFDEEIDGRALLMMGRKDLATYFNLKVGPTVKLFSLIVNLRIAVACKFKTTQTGLNYKRSKMPMPSNEGISFKKQEYADDKLKSKLDNRSVSDRSSNSPEQQEETEAGSIDDDYDQDDYTAQEITDEEDVLLDSDDFLSVKPSHSIATTTNMDKESDVTMTTLDWLPPGVANIS